MNHQVPVVTSEESALVLQIFLLALKSVCHIELDLGCELQLALNAITDSFLLVKTSISHLHYHQKIRTLASWATFFFWLAIKGDP